MCSQSRVEQKYFSENEYVVRKTFDIKRSSSWAFLPGNPGLFSQFEKAQEEDVAKSVFHSRELALEITNA